MLLSDPSPFKSSLSYSPSYSRSTTSTELLLLLLLALIVLPAKLLHLSVDLKIQGRDEIFGDISEPFPHVEF